MRPLSLLVALSWIAAAPAHAAVTQPGFADEIVAGGLSRPAAMAFAPDGRLFVCLQGGQVRVLKDGALLPAPFLSLTVDSAGERGLLGIAFDPDFALNQFVYVYYTVPGVPRHNRVSRVTASGDVAVPGSEVVILELDALSSATNHNGGALHFGPDGKLYVAVGENANGSNAQSLANLLGKVLRIDADGGIPADNPFFNRASGRNRAIWALGLRNPFTFAFHPVTGRMHINDVGQNTWEEVNEGTAGANYGWPATEGPTGDPAFQSPIHAYAHGASTTTGCAIAGGAFYAPATPVFPNEYADDYFFADLCSGWINRRDALTGAVSTFATGLSAPVDLRVGPDGALYYLERGTTAGRVGRIAPAAPVSQPVGHLDLPRVPAATQPFAVAGWAIDLGASSGTGVSTVHVWAYPNPGSGESPVFLGVAAPASRPDVGAAFGAQFTMSGYGLVVRGLRPGLYRIAAFALSTVNGTFNAEVVTLTVTASPAMFVDAPVAGAVLGQPFFIGGWAIDRAAAVGPGVATLHIWAYPLAGGPPIFLGVADYGRLRPDVAAAFGVQFQNSGWGLIAGGLPPGAYNLAVFSYSYVSASFSLARVVQVTVL